MRHVDSLDACLGAVEARRIKTHQTINMGELLVSTCSNPHWQEIELLTLIELNSPTFRDWTSTLPTNDDPTCVEGAKPDTEDSVNAQRAKARDSFMIVSLKFRLLDEISNENLVVVVSSSAAYLLID